MYKETWEEQQKLRRFCCAAGILYARRKGQSGTKSPGQSDTPLRAPLCGIPILSTPSMVHTTHTSTANDPTMTTRNVMQKFKE